jgi:hypothetical protein
VAAEVRLEERGSRSDSQAFRLLFDYISGANAGGREIAMTAPVEQAGTEIAMTAPVEMSEGDDVFVMRFFLPEGFTVESAPVPLRPEVAIVGVPEEHVAVAGFTGWWTERGIARRQADLIDQLAESVWQSAGTPTAWFYDPPWTLPFLRRNEIAVPVEQRN